ncbi:translocation/assembly module TamB domain-containing protein [Candidatus Magnetaquicoccus inordinatus]|uniref:translocation/assembly module TamB domain-containing protein n=1 Tax=Candidatus Magnetaquicoccus inordinatus TaxID=2496818 RepID=UPI00102B449D|nr:translocation/assembly module TamB domain-containing protein [Candidatus Magnetaquicoccus inordinatus]
MVDPVPESATPADAVTPLPHGTASRVMQRVRTLSRLLLFLFVFCVLTLSALLFAVQQEAFQDLLAQLLQEMWSGTEQQLQLQQLRGRLPWEIELAGLHWQDGQGNRLQVDQLRLHWSWQEMVQGRLRFQQVQANRLHWQQGGPAPTVQSSANNKQGSVAKLSVWSFLQHLPPLLIDHLSIPLLLIDGQAEQQTAGFAVDGSLRHIMTDDAAAAGNRQWQAHLQLQPLDAGESRLQLQAHLTHGQTAEHPPELFLRVEGQERSGWLAAWSGIRAAKGVAVHLEGQGALSTWQGELTLQVEGVAALQGRISNHAEEGDPHWRFTGQISGESTFLGTEWARALTPLSKEAKLDSAPPPERLLLHIDGMLVGLPEQKWQLKNLQMQAPTVQGRGEGSWDGKSQQIQANLHWQMPQLQPLSKLLGRELAGAGEVDLTVQGTWPRAEWQLLAQANQLTVADWHAAHMTAHWQGEWEQPLPRFWQGQGVITELRWQNGPVWNHEPLQWSSKLQRGEGRELFLTELHIDDASTAATLQGKLHLGNLRGEGKWQLQSRHLEKWVQRWQADWAHWQGEGEWSGEWHLAAAEQGQQASGQQLHISMDGALHHLHGLPVGVQALLGERVHTQARWQWHGSRGWRVDDLQVQGAHLQGKGALQGDAAGQQQSGKMQWQSAHLASWTRQAALDWQGDLRADLQWEGPLTAPRLQWTLQGTEWQIASWQWPQPHLSGSVESWHPAPRGVIKAILPGLEQQTLPFSTGYRLEGSLLQLSDLKLAWPGGQLSSDSWQVDLQRRIANGRWQGSSNTPGAWLRWLSLDSVQPPADWEGAVAMQLQWQGQGGQQHLQANGEGHVVRGSFGMLDKATIKADIQDLWGEMRGRIDGKINKLQWGNLQLRSASLSVSGQRRALQIHSSGSGMLRLSAMDELHSPLPLPVSRPALKPIKQEPLAWELQSKVQMDDKGVIHGTLHHLSGHIGADTLQLNETAQLTLTPEQRRGKKGLAHLQLQGLSLGYGPARLQTHLHFDAQKVDMEGELRLPLSLVQRVGGPQLQGTARARWRVSGSSSQPEGELSLFLDKIHIKEPALEAVPPATLQATMRLEKGIVNGQLSLQDLTSHPVTAHLLLPVRLSFVPWQLSFAETGAIGGKLQADAQLAQFALMAAPGLMDSQKLDGLLKIDLQLAGTVAAPEVNGTIVMRDGSYENGSLGTLLKNIHLDVRAQGETFTIDRLEANDGGQGRISATGQLSLAWQKQLPFHLQATIEKSMLVRRDDWQATVHGVLDLQGNRQQLAISGELTGNEVLLYLADSESLDIQTVSVDSEIRNGLHVATVQQLKGNSATPVTLDLLLHLPSRVFLRGRGLESEWHGDLAVRGMVGDPRLDGRIVVRRGFFEFLDQRFDLRKGIISFDGASPPQPHLDLEAESRNSGGMVAVLRLQGPAFNPSLTLGSDPELPQDELLARILFNSNRQQLTPAQAVGLAVAVEKLRTGGPGLLGKARDSLGIDRLEFGGESAEGGSVKAGKYLGENLLLGVERGVKQGSGKVSVELELMPNVVVQTEMDETNKSGIGMNWKMDY